MEKFIQVTKALREPNRVAILKMLQDGELCVCEIQEALEIAQPTVSKHLDILVSAGLVECRRDRHWVYYRIASAPETPYGASILGNLRYWLENDETVMALYRKIPEIRKRNLCSK